MKEVLKAFGFFAVAAMLAIFISSLMEKYDSRRISSIVTTNNVPVIRFICIYSQSVGMERIWIIKDSKTGRLYLCNKKASSGGITLMPENTPE